MHKINIFQRFDSISERYICRLGSKYYHGASDKLLHTDSCTKIDLCGIDVNFRAHKESVVCCKYVLPHLLRLLPRVLPLSRRSSRPRFLRRC